MDMEEKEVGEEDKKRRVMCKKESSSSGAGGGNSGSVSSRLCQVEKCSVDLSEAKKYHRRHRVCEAHAKASEAMVAGLRQRFCQQCSRFHELKEFDEAKRSCRRRLAGHNERRRKNSGGSSGEGSSQREASSQFIQTYERIKVPKTPPTINSSSKQTQIR